MFLDTELYFDNYAGGTDTADTLEYDAWLEAYAAIERERTGEAYYPTPVDFAHITEGWS